MKPKHILFGLLALIGASCTNDDLNEVAEMKQNGIQVTAGLTTNTRVNFEQDGNVTHAYWEEGDQITLYAPSQGCFNYQVSNLGEGGYSATFAATDNALQNTDETIYAAYPALHISDEMAVLEGNYYWPDEKPMPFAYAIGKVADGKLNLSFNHVYAYIKLTLNAETVAASNIKEITDLWITNPSGTPIALAAGRFDFSSQSIVEEKGIDYLSYKLKEPFIATGTAEKSIYIPIFPQPAGETIHLSVLHTTQAGVDTLFTVSKEVPSTGFVAGRAYTYLPKSSITRVGNTITLTEAGTLSQVISAAEKDTITSLKIIGPLNGDDIRFIREMAGSGVRGNATEGKLVDLDISEATIVEGGDMYYNDTANLGECYTENDVLGNFMFSYTKLQRILPPVNITSIGNSAFRFCESLTDVVIPEMVASLGDYAFSFCIKLTDINLPETITSIGFEAFSACNLLNNIIIPESVTTIGDFAFSDCHTFTKIIIPDNVTSIGAYTFQRCYNMTEVAIGNGVMSIGNSAFRGCSALQTIVIPDGVTEIADYTFSECSSLSSITIGNGVTSIGESAFYHCSLLKSINLPNAVTSIGEDAFMHCSVLKYINIPDAVTSIGEGTFSGCSSLTSIDIPDGVTEISNSLFYNCISLTSITIPNGVTSIGKNAFYNCSFTSITIPDSVTSIGEEAFDCCSALTSIIIPDGVTSISNSSFNRCTSLASVSIPDGVTSIGSYAFSGCSFTYITIPESVASIGDAAFYGCSSLSSFNIPNGVTEINYRTFSECFSLTSIIIPDSVTSIGEEAFYYCSSLASINIPDGVTEIGYNVFKYCSSLASIDIPDGVTSIGRYAFEGCSSLTSIVIPDGVTSIGEESFGSCSMLSEVTCNATTPPTLGYSAFDDIASPATLYIPTSCGTAYSESDWAQYFTTIEEK